MARLPRAALHTLWILFFSYATNEVMAAGHVQEFACFTDYDKELVCHWKVPAHMDCSKEFLIYYRKESHPLLNSVCVPESGKDRLCTCTIHPKFFVSGLTYILALQFNGTDTWNYRVTPALVVKPRPPKNLAVEKTENGNFNLSWEESYSPSSILSGQPVIYEVKYWRKQHPTEVSVKAINYQAKSFEIVASSLQRGYDYAASVRCKYLDYPAYWSEWSEEVEFPYDYQTTAEDALRMAVPVACVLIMAVSVSCYFCFTKVKKEWWDQIPNPAKSHLVVKNVKLSVLCYIDEIKFPFHDLKQSHMENKRSCTDCLSQRSSGHNFKGNDNIRSVEKSCSCHGKPGEWFPKGRGAVLTPEAVPVESVEICECLTEMEADSQEETSDQLPVFEPCEGSVDAFREHNEAIARMFSDLLADENSVQDPDITRGENKTFEKLESENASHQSPKESTTKHQQPFDIPHTISLFTRVSQEDYSCSTASKKSKQSEESFDSGYRSYQSSSINSASLDAGSFQCTVHQGFFPCSSGSHHDSCVLIQRSPNKASCRTREGSISSLAHKSFDPLVSPSMGLCSSAYKSCDTLMSTSVEPCGSAYKSFDVLVSAFKEPSSSAYKSFDTLLSQSVANSSLALCFENVCFSLPLAQISETPELSCRDQIYQPPISGMCYAGCRSPCTELGFQNTSSEQTDFPSFFTPANYSASAFLPEEEMHKQVTYQNVHKKATVIPCPTGPQASGCQSFDNAVKCSGTCCDNAREGISGSLYKPFVHLLYSNLGEALPDPICVTPDRRTDGHMCLVVQHFDRSIAPHLASSKSFKQTSDGSLQIISSDELPAESKDENSGREEQVLCLLEQSCQDFNSGEKTAKGTKPNSCSSARQGVQERSSSGLSADFHCHTYKHLRELGKAGENKEVMQHVAGRKCGSAAALPEESLDSTGLNLERKTAKPPQLLVSDKSPPPLFVDSCPDSHIIHSEGSQLVPAVGKRPVELLRENGKNGKEMESVQGLAQEDNCYMKIA